MDYWPEGWECRRVVEMGNGCEFYDPNGVNNQCGHPDRSCIYSNSEELCRLNGIGLFDISDLTFTPDEISALD